MFFFGISIKGHMSQSHHSNKTKSMICRALNMVEVVMWPLCCLPVFFRPFSSFLLGYPSTQMGAMWASSFPPISTFLAHWHSRFLVNVKIEIKPFRTSTFQVSLTSTRKKENAQKWHPESPAVALDAAQEMWSRHAMQQWVTEKQFNPSAHTV